MRWKVIRCTNDTNCFHRNFSPSLIKTANEFWNNHPTQFRTVIKYTSDHSTSVGPSDRGCHQTDRRCRHSIKKHILFTAKLCLPLKGVKRDKCLIAWLRLCGRVHIVPRPKHVLCLVYRHVGTSPPSQRNLQWNSVTSVRSHGSVPDWSSSVLYTLNKHHFPSWVLKSC